MSAVDHKQQLDPGQLDTHVEDGMQRLERAADAIYRATVKAGEAERVFRRASLQAIAELEREYQERRMPAQDIREALVFPRLSNEWDGYYIAKYELEALEKSSRLLTAAVSAAQSLAKMRGNW